MGSQNLENVSLTLLPGGTLTGEFIFEGNLAADLTPQQKSSFRVNLFPKPGYPGRLPGWGIDRRELPPTPSDNSFRLQSIFPGDFRVMVSPFISPFSWTPQTLSDPLEAFS